MEIIIFLGIAVLITAIDFLYHKHRAVKRNKNRKARRESFTETDEANYETDPGYARKHKDLL